MTCLWVVSEVRTPYSVTRNGLPSNWKSTATIKTYILKSMCMHNLRCGRNKGAFSDLRLFPEERFTIATLKKSGTCPSQSSSSTISPTQGQCYEVSCSVSGNLSTAGFTGLVNYCCFDHRENTLANFKENAVLILHDMAVCRLLMGFTWAWMVMTYLNWDARLSTLEIQWTVMHTTKS